MGGCTLNQKVRTPLANFLLLADVHCEDIANFISTRLKTAAFSFRWVDRENKQLVVGPIVTKQDVENPFIVIRATYYLTIVCLSELNIKISGDGIFEGLILDDDNYYDNDDRYLTRLLPVPSTETEQMSLHLLQFTR